MKKISRSTFLKRAKDTIKHYDMLRPGDRVLVAVSGGPDSVALLKALFEMRRSLGIEIVVGNLDHGIRGRQSRRDSDFVESLSQDMGLPFEHERIDLKSRPKGKKSLEERAREKRYGFLKKAAKKNGCSAIATGHTLDDQAETVLMRIITGTSVAGLTGIPPLRSEGELKFIRPFIRLSKQEVIDYLEASGQKYVEDLTNRDVKIKRNMIRLKVIPFLEKLNPRVKRSLSNMADILREDFLALKAEEEKASGVCIKGRKGPISLKITDLVLHPRALRKAILKESVKRAGGNLKKLTHRHWIDMDYFLRAGKKGKSIDLPGDIRMTKASDRIVFRKRT
ncbi:MAG: tRNA lysidine(34) synthetase TilS [Candidatus Omnitrophota bacterium]